MLKSLIVSSRSPYVWGMIWLDMMHSRMEDSGLRCRQVLLRAAQGSGGESNDGCQPSFASFRFFQLAKGSFSSSCKLIQVSVFMRLPSISLSIGKSQLVGWACCTAPFWLLVSCTEAGHDLPFISRSVFILGHIERKYLLFYSFCTKQSSSLHFHSSCMINTSCYMIAVFWGMWQIQAMIWIQN